MSRTKYVVMVPIEITIEKQFQLKRAIRDIRDMGPFPSCDSYGEDYYSWRVRCDKVRLKHAKATP